MSTCCPSEVMSTVSQPYTSNKNSLIDSNYHRHQHPSRYRRHRNGEYYICSRYPTPLFCDICECCPTSKSSLNADMKGKQKEEVKEKEEDEDKSPLNDKCEANGHKNNTKENLLLNGKRKRRRRRRSQCKIRLNTGNEHFPSCVNDHHQHNNHHHILRSTSISDCPTKASSSSSCHYRKTANHPQNQNYCYSMYFSSDSE